MYAQRGSGKRSSSRTTPSASGARPRAARDRNWCRWARPTRLQDGAEAPRSFRAHTCTTDQRRTCARGRAQARAGGRVRRGVQVDAAQSGVAMRFPRLHRIHWDKPAAEPTLSIRCRSSLSDRAGGRHTGRCKVRHIVGTILATHCAVKLCPRHCVHWSARRGRVNTGRKENARLTVLDLLDCHRRHRRLARRPPRQGLRLRPHRQHRHRHPGRRHRWPSGARAPSLYRIDGRQYRGCASRIADSAPARRAHPPDLSRRACVRLQ